MQQTEDKVFFCKERGAFDYKELYAFKEHGDNQVQTISESADHIAQTNANALAETKDKITSTISRVTGAYGDAILRLVNSEYDEQLRAMREIGHQRSLAVERANDIKAQVQKKEEDLKAFDRDQEAQGKAEEYARIMRETAVLKLAMEGTTQRSAAKGIATMSRPLVNNGTVPLFDGTVDGAQGGHGAMGGQTVLREVTTPVPTVDNTSMYIDPNMANAVQAQHDAAQRLRCASGDGDNDASERVNSHQEDHGCDDDDDDDDAQFRKAFAESYGQHPQVDDDAKHGDGDEKTDQHLETHVQAPTELRAKLVPALVNDPLLALSSGRSRRATADYRAGVDKPRPEQSIFIGNIPLTCTTTQPRGPPSRQPPQQPPSTGSSAQRVRPSATTSPESLAYNESSASDAPSNVSGVHLSDEDEDTPSLPSLSRVSAVPNQTDPAFGILMQEMRQMQEDAKADRVGMRDFLSKILEKMDTRA